MKIRNGFVSNSSSSSFICEICNHTESGWDASPNDLGFSTCINGHILCDEHFHEGEQIEDDDYGYSYPQDCCPICLFEEISYPEIAKYLEEKYEISRDEVFAKIKELNKRRKKLYHNEYVEYVFKEKEITDDIILKKLKEKYNNYSNFINRNKEK